MADEANTATTEQTTTSSQTATAQPVTPSTAVNVDINQIITQAESKAAEAAEKKMTAVFQSMLEQQGLDKAAIATMTAEWKAKQVTPEQQIKAAQDAAAAAQAKVEAYEQDVTLSKKEIPSAFQNLVKFEAKQLMTDGVDFAAAVDLYIAANPLPAMPPAFATGDPKKLPNATEAEQIKEQYKAAAKNRDSAEMARITRIANSKGIPLY